MAEIEVKVLDVNIEDVRSALISNGAVLVKKEMQENHIFALPGTLMSENGYVRIRRVHNLLDNSINNILCVKKLISQGKSRITDEHEVKVSDLDECKKLLSSIGLDFNSLKKKYRESYNLKDVLVEIDTWDKNVYPEPYIEVEAESEDKIFEVLSILNIPQEKATSKTLEEIKKERGIL